MQSGYAPYTGAPSSPTALYWDLPDLLCEHYNKFQGKVLQIVPGLGIPWSELPIDPLEEQDTAAIFDIFFETQTTEKFYLAEKDIVDFNKWKTKFADGNTWLKLKLNFSSDSYFGDPETDEFFKSIYEDKCFRIISSGIDQKGLYVGIDPQNGFLREILKPMIILLGATGKIG